jgi:hypothetical protein
MHGFSFGRQSHFGAATRSGERTDIEQETELRNVNRAHTTIKSNLASA